MSELAQKGGKLRKLLLRGRAIDSGIGEPTVTELEVEHLKEQLQTVTAERDIAHAKLESIKSILD